MIGDTPARSKSTACSIEQARPSGYISLLELTVDAAKANVVPEIPQINHTLTDTFDFDVHNHPLKLSADKTAFPSNLTISAAMDVSCDLDTKCVCFSHLEQINIGKPKTTKLDIYQICIDTVAPPLTLPTDAGVAARRFWPISTESRAFDPKLQADIPMTRRREHAPNEVRFLVEKRILAKTADVEEAEIAWIGLFSRVPLAAAAAIEIDEHRGILSVFFKPDSVELSQRAKVATVKLAMGRNRISGEIVQAIVR